MNAAIYATVSTFDQEPENQLQELRRYFHAKDWTAVEYVDRACQARRTVDPHSTSSSHRPSGSGSMSWCVGGWIDSEGTSVNWSPKGLASQEHFSAPSLAACAPSCGVGSR